MKKAIILSLIFHLVLLGIYTRPNTKIIDEEIKTRYKVGMVSLKESYIKGKEEKIASPSLFNKEKIDNATKKVDSPEIVKEKKTKKKPSTYPQLPKPIEEIEKPKSEKKRTAVKAPEKYKANQFEEVIPKKKEVTPARENHTVKKEPIKEDNQDTKPLAEREKEEKKQETESIKSADTQSKEEQKEEVKEEPNSKETDLKTSKSSVPKSLPDDNILEGTSSSTLVKENSQLTYSILKMPKERFPQKAERIRIKEDIIIEASFIIGLDGHARDINLKSDFKDYEKYGFAKEVKRVIKGYRFSSIYYREERVEVLFHRKFIFRKR